MALFCLRVNVQNIAAMHWSSMMMYSMTSEKQVMTQILRTFLYYRRNAMSKQCKIQGGYQFAPARYAVRLLFFENAVAMLAEYDILPHAEVL